jgi:hypothetical protein
MPPSLRHPALPESQYLAAVRAEKDDIATYEESDSTGPPVDLGQLLATMGTKR